MSPVLDEADDVAAMCSTTTAPPVEEEERTEDEVGDCTWKGAAVDVARREEDEVAGRGMEEGWEAEDEPTMPPSAPAVDEDGVTTTAAVDEGCVDMDVGEDDGDWAGEE